MPGETGQQSEGLAVEAVLDLLACIVGVDVGPAAKATLSELELDSDRSILHLWAAVVEEFGERRIDDLELDGTRPVTLGELAELFTRELDDAPYGRGAR